MPLSVGSRLGHHGVTARLGGLGEGGMPLPMPLQAHATLGSYTVTAKIAECDPSLFV